ncbi:MAG TPA: signal recognition particle-docking protein FtsY [Acidobacteria bacterium]|nr:signal recognition particle-docking protein FtsY [Acidobacteriota bacterium]
MSFIERLHIGLRRTAQEWSKRLDELSFQVASKDELTSVRKESLEALEELLIEADVGLVATKTILQRVRETGGQDGSALRSRVQAEVLSILTGPKYESKEQSTPRVVLVVGVNGTGKTTTVGKLAELWRREGLVPLICAADTFRAAAVEQVETWAKRAAVDIVRSNPGADPASVVYDAMKAGQARNCDVVVVDTAGRLHTRSDLMDELGKIRRVVAREIPGAPHEVLMVLDATVGQNGVVQARQFLEVAGVTGIILTKLDGTAKGGVAIAIAGELGLPIRYVGVGEGIRDLLPFTPEAYVEALFGQSVISSG